MTERVIIIVLCSIGFPASCMMKFLMTHKPEFTGNSAMYFMLKKTQSKQKIVRRISMLHYYLQNI